MEEQIYLSKQGGVDDRGELSGQRRSEGPQEVGQVNKEPGRQITGGQAEAGVQALVSLLTLWLPVHPGNWIGEAHSISFSSTPPAP